jgi:hypothetical protein
MEEEGEREREEQIYGVRDRVLDRCGSGVGQKKLVKKKNLPVFLAIQINRINKLLIKLGVFQILLFFWCRNIHSHNTMFHHTKGLLLSVTSTQV